MGAIPERLRGVFTTRRYIQIHVYLTLPIFAGSRLVALKTTG